jgi:SAM-dependent methyltransferase
MTTFRDAVIDYLSPYEGYFNYQTMLDGELDITRFGAWADLAGQFRPIAGATVLSSGCGSGGDLWAFLERGARRAYGIEVNRALSRLAGRRFAGTEYANRACIATYGGLTLPYGADAFDIVFSIHVLEHTLDPSRYLAELFRVLRPGGVLFLDFPNRYYAVEQHTSLKFFHYLPTQQRDRFIRLALHNPLSRYLSKDTQYKLRTYQNVHFLSPGQLMRLFREYQPTFSLQLLDAYYHSYTAQRMGFRETMAPYVLGSARGFTTFRFIVTKEV